MGTAYRNFGPCVPQVGTGSSSAMETLGVSQKGGRIQIQTRFKEIHSDLSGPMAEAELQQMGQTARLTMELIAPDEAIIAKIILRSVANAGGTDGTPGTPGALMGTGGHAFGLYIPSGNVNPWYFPTCVLEDPDKLEGTESEPFRLTFRAWRFIPGTASAVSSSYKLYQRSAPP